MQDYMLASGAALVTVLLGTALIDQSGGGSTAAQQQWVSEDTSDFADTGMSEVIRTGVVRVDARAPDKADDDGPAQLLTALHTALVAIEGDVPVLSGP